MKCANSTRREGRNLYRHDRGAHVVSFIANIDAGHEGHRRLGHENSLVIWMIPADGHCR